MTTLLNSLHAPAWVMCLILVLALWLAVRLAIKIIRTMREVRELWRQADEKHFQAVRRNYQKAHELDGRGA